MLKCYIHNVVKVHDSNLLQWNLDARVLLTVCIFVLVHEKVAEWLEKNDNQSFAVLAHHYKQGIFSLLSPFFYQYVSISFWLMIVAQLLSFTLMKFEFYDAHS
jgi:sensor histidine kinase YesM